MQLNVSSPIPLCCLLPLMPARVVCILWVIWCIWYISQIKQLWCSQIIVSVWRSVFTRLISRPYPQIMLVLVFYSNLRGHNGLSGNTHSQRSPSGANCKRQLAHGSEPNPKHYPHKPWILRTDCFISLTCFYWAAPGTACVSACY